MLKINDRSFYQLIFLFKVIILTFKYDKTEFINNGEESHVTINTSFSGKHAELIKEYSNTFQCNKPTALRLILNQLSAGLLITLDTGQEKQIKRLIDIPILHERYGFQDTKSFVNWAINVSINRLTQELGKLSDPAVQMLLDLNEQNIAKTLLLMSRDIDFYGGITLEKITDRVDLDEDHVRRILEFFVRSNWVLCQRDPKYGDKYFPKD
jgi:hypothetical protein